MTIDISEVYQGLRNNIFQNRTINVAPRTITNDLFLQPVALEISKQKIIVSFTSYLQSFSGILSLIANTSFLSTVAEAFNTTPDNVTSVINTAADNLASNYNNIRKSATNATGIASYYRPDAPATSELTNVISAGSIVQSITGITYTTTENVLYSQFYFDSTFNAYMIDVPVECSSTGSLGNAEQYTITTINTAVSNWPNVTNKIVITNGRDTESTSALCYRCQTEISGSNIGTLNGIKNLILNNTPIIDLSVVGAGDENMTRDLGWGGMVDVYITDVNPEQVTWTYYADGLATVYIQGMRPLIPTAEILVSSDSVTVTPTIDTVVADTSSPVEGSIQAMDSIQWAVAPPAGTTVTITYFINKYISDVQEFISQDVYNTGSDILIKQAIVVPVDIIFSIVTFPQYSEADIINTITVAIENVLNTKKIGETLEQSDIIALAQNVTGVDRVVTPLTKFNRTSLTGTVDVIYTTKFEYIRTGTIRIG